MLWQLFLAVVVLAATYRLITTSHRRRRDDAFSRVFHPHELCELDQALEEIAATELRRLHANVVDYISGHTGHVVAISESRQGVALVLSDGNRLALSGLGVSTRRSLQQLVSKDRLRLAGIDRDRLAYRVLLRGESGAEFAVHTQRVALAP
jgi:hypothetical protein